VTARDDWSVEHLAEFLARVSAYPDERSAVAGAVERAAEAVEAEIVAVLFGHDVVCAVGYPRGSVPEQELIEAATGRSLSLTVPGAGPQPVLVIPFDGAPDRVMLVARAHEPLTTEEVTFLRGMGRVLALTVDLLHLVASERQQASENARLLVAVQERSALFERLFQLQRLISHRAPTQDVLDAVTEGTADLLRASVAVLLLLDDREPGVARLASSVGMPPDLGERVRETPMAAGISGQAMMEDRMVVIHDHPLDVVEGWLPPRRAAMATPVHREGRVVGSLLVASDRPGERYTSADQDALLSFAEHVSLALNDAAAIEGTRRAISDALHRANHDALTDLPNRTLAVDRLDQALLRSNRAGGEVAVLFIDLDRFKSVNDSLGHSMGDVVLVQVADRLRGMVRATDTVARLAGDEFVVICENSGPREAARVASKIANALVEPIRLGSRHTVITSSIGVAIGGPGSRAEDLLRDADVAMYRAKELGRARIEQFDEAMRVRTLERIDVEHDLRQALQAHELRLHFQPVVALATGRVTAVEALVRWQHPERGLVMPAGFVPVAEDSGLIFPIGQWVLNESCAQLAAARRQDPSLRNVAVAVNLSTRQFSDPGLVDIVTNALGQAGLPPTALCLEITESVLMGEAETAAQSLCDLKALGVGLVIDDFGTGYSSLAYLKRFPVDGLKIDRAFVAGLGENSEDEAIVAAIVSLGHVLGHSVVAEGVETPEQMRRLQGLGCDFAQGYLISKPLPTIGAADWASTGIEQLAPVMGR